MKRMAIVTLAVALEGEKGYSRFRFLANLLSNYYEVDLITSTFQHWEKKQRQSHVVENMKSSYGICLAYEPGYKKNVDLRRIHSHKVAGKNIVKILQKKQYDLIYCIIPDNRVASKVGKYAKENGIKFLVDVEDLWPEAMEMVSHLPQILNRLMFHSFRKGAKMAYRYADGIVGTSDEYRDVPKNKYGIGNKPAITVYVGCDLDDFDAGVREFTKEIVKPEDEFWITYAGNLGSSYDIPTLIRAAQELFETNPEIKVKILGGGPLEDSFQAMAQEKNCNVEFVGYTPYKKMAAFLDKSDVLINSFVKKAPQSIVTKVGDYLAAGKPMINTLSSPEFRKKVETDGFGVNVEAEDAESLKKSIVHLKEEPELVKAMGSAARAVAKKEFDRAKSYLCIQKLIETVLS